ncbi:MULTISPECIES: isocitrate/isopropylmalate dehydrogenase family protein [unclassified Methanoregula]|uniref:isocitrate/isopropylmalate dehydrogenase family protein n=1 Tax=unclassified Methanoregula TaxID=2649730 RepID=UPI0009D2D9B7|nr:MULTISPECIES: isocitrate/isopropylmalate dehydrogenase family protein [unclassified Methanoregula]OPX62021.1 MAG: Homoisocitrate dehydrogenase [Methanoregula sp. PtaB.Bin085]OPY34304.1 MAG: Homoisocitrate dehydrogenase [Methanoregula sp. PtaU1.Bin006]
MTRIAVVEGDGIGHEVIPVARSVLELLHPEYDFFNVEVGYGRWERTGCPCTDPDIAQLKNSDAILFGAITTPPMKDYQSVVLRIRKALDLYANLRPVRGDGIDIMIVRENTEGLYSGIEETTPDRATTLRVVSRKGTERIIRKAIDLARQRKGILTIGHKANVIKSDVFFRDICLSEAKAANIACNDRFIDALSLDLLQHPKSYDVVVTTNMFGDILSDVAAYLVGGLGVVPSANIGDRYALFEPVHGSAPDIAGRNIANPVAAIRSAAMLLDHLGDPNGAGCIEESVLQVLNRGIRTRDLGGTTGTREFGDALIQELRQKI